MQTAVPSAVSRVALNFQVILSCRALDFRLHAVSRTLGCKPRSFQLSGHTQLQGS
jgi:hypothetical protein